MKKDLDTFRIGETVELLKPLDGPKYGTVTQITKAKVRVLFPIHKYVWLSKGRVAHV